MSGFAQLGPLVLVREPGYHRGRQEALRDLVGRHDDAGWLTARPPTGKTTLPALSQDLLDASGIVGLRPPRQVGEAHTLRVLPHWLHGPLRDLVISDAQDIEPAALDDALHTATVTGLTLWVLTNGIAPSAGWLSWAAGRSGELVSLPQALSMWGKRVRDPELCQPPAGTWWETVAWWPRLEACPVHDERARCVLSWIRRGAGRPRPSQARKLLGDLLAHRASTVADHWALRDASRDLLTPATDVIVRLGMEQAHRKLEVRDVSRNGATITERDTPSGAPRILQVPPMMRPALARQRSAQIWAGCSPRTPLLGLDGEEAWIV